MRVKHNEPARPEPPFVGLGMLEVMRQMGRDTRWHQRRVARGLGMDVIPGHETTMWNPGTGRWELHKVGDESLTDMEPGEAEYNRRQDGLPESPS